ncbi:hypothetical protein KKC13_11155 [bacterium]|nr:hypothetical protein [bacterium]MBU1958133.1 hypothetical protein [bacterium]
MGETDNIKSIGKDRQAIAIFFNNEKNKLELFNQVVKLIETNNDFFYIKNNADLFNTFKDCIINGHFQWIVDIASNNYDSIEFDSKYTIECVESDSIYLDFYQNFEKIIPSLHLSPIAKNILSKYSIFLKEEYL